MKRVRVEFGSAIILAALVLVLLFPSFSQAQSDERVEITNRLYCEITSFGDGPDDFWSELVRVKPDSSERYLQISRWLKNSRSRLKRLRQRRRSARGLERSRLRQRIQRQRGIRLDVISCRDGELGDPDTGDDIPDGPGDGDGDGDGGDQPGSSASACEVFGDSTALSSRIINGDKCSTGDSPVVFLVTANGFSCTGTAITKRAVLSAGHCFTDEDGDLNEDHVDVYYAEGEAGEGSIRSFNIEIHPDYDGGVSAGTNDTALVLLDEDLPVRTVNILKDNDLEEEERLLIAGYGRIGEAEADGDATDGLQAGGMRIHQIFEGNIIALFDYHDPADEDNNSNTCNGDSGGPALVYRSDKWVLAGITSYGNQADCGPTDTSGFQNVTDPDTLSFIEDHVPALF